MRVLAIDLGRQLGFGLLGGERVLSGSREVVKRWSPLGPSFLMLEDKIQGLIDIHMPNVLACATPFVRRGRGGAMIDTPQNLVPMFGCYAVLHMLAADNRIPLETIEESHARSVMLGRFMPRKSDAVKLAIQKACRERGWPVCDDHAGDALCIAAAITERLAPAEAHLTTPLFIAASAHPPPRKRRRRAA